MMKTIKSIFLGIFIQLVSALISVNVLLFLLVKRIQNGSNYFTFKQRKTPPALLNDPKWGTHRYVQLPKQKIRLHYVENGDRDKPLIVCLHGFPECWFSMRTILEELSDEFWVVALDMRGYGGSDKPAATSSYATLTLIEDIREFIKVLGKDKCNLVAHDWGGALAWMLTVYYPELFKKHVSMNGPHFAASRDHRKSSMSQMLKSWYMVFFQTPYVPELFCRAGDFRNLEIVFRDEILAGPKMTDEELEVYKYYFSQENALSAPINYYRNIDLFSPAPGKTRCPVDSLVIWGTQDLALDKEIVELTFKYCDNLQVQYFSDSGHFIIQEKPKECNQLIRQFFKE